MFKENTNLSLSNFDKIPYFVVKPFSKANRYSLQINKTKVVNFAGYCKLRTHIKQLLPSLTDIYKSNMGYYLNSLNKLKDEDILPIEPNIIKIIPYKTFSKLIYLLKVLEPFELMVSDKSPIILGYRFVAFDKNYREKEI